MNDLHPGTDQNISQIRFSLEQWIDDEFQTGTADQKCIQYFCNFRFSLHMGKMIELHPGTEDQNIT